MRREPSLRFEGALEILGAQQPKTLARLGKVLGGVIIGSGIAAGLATVGPAWRRWRRSGAGSTRRTKLFSWSGIWSARLSAR
jgi:hypothetical protein